ncbi:FtsX-like permease family protein [Pseudolysobacter antarcticus]|uniref:FtsX-like permease family protein n=1 Tax=Pseudolysobacter antarcticus TaxID=2511995 RepID=A0A411HF54_9GAMM|nr:ABC transporter permease [Pseudolysobacter antarcticus]QBB69107.1 FtsX-like permease family protein [Pseudolysobacter antarcticus]
MSFAAVFRRQMRTPFFALSIMLLIAVVVAINATAFGAIHALRWKALPYQDGERLIELAANLQKFDLKIGLSERLRRILAEDHAHFSGVAGFSVESKSRSDDAGRGWHLARTSWDFDRVLGIAPQLGRGFSGADAQAGTDNVLLISDALWRTRFAADQNIIGQHVRFGDESFSVIGVMPRGFVFPDAAVDAWRPYVLSAMEQEQSDNGAVGDLDIIARLAPDSDAAQAEIAATTLLGNDVGVAGLIKNTRLKFDARAWRERYAAGHWQALVLLQLAALILLAVVSATLINLTLDRLLGRARELGIRRAMGARESDIARSIAADLAPPVLLGLVIGMALVPFGLRLVAAHNLLPDNLPQGFGFGPVTLFTALLVTLLALGGTLIAALLAQRSPQLASRSGISGLGHVRPLMLVCQVMLTTALLGGAGLLLRSAANLMSVDRGFDERGVLITAIDPSGTRAGAPDPTSDPARWETQVAALRDEIASLPGVDQVAIANSPPFSNIKSFVKVGVPGQDEMQSLRGVDVGPGYFSTLGIAITAGREFERGDAGKASPVIVDERYRQRYLQGIDPIGATIELNADAGMHRSARIIGVARTVKQDALDERTDLPLYYGYATAPTSTLFLVTRTHGDPAALAESVRQRILSRLPDAGIVANRPLAEMIVKTLSDRHALLEALGAFAIATLVLAGLGLAAVLGFSVRRRSAEFGVRMALGANAARIIGLVMRQGGALIVAGATLGVLCGIPFAYLLSDRLYGIAYSDAQTWGLTALIVASVAAFACWLPARQAAAVVPLVALRRE